MELFASYPTAFLVTIVLPIFTGLIMAVAGYDGLKARSDSDKQLSRIESNTANTLNQLPNINATLATLNRYEKTLSDAGARDEVLGAVLAQYKGMKHASEVWEQFRASKNHEEKKPIGIRGFGYSKYKSYSSYFARKFAEQTSNFRSWCKHLQSVIFRPYAHSTRA